MTKLITLISLLLIGICASLSASEDAGAQVSKRLNDIVYAKVGSRELHLDLVLPVSKPGEKHPAVVWIHGGGWSKGSHKQNRAAWLTTHGYVAASVEYRLTHEATFPAQIHDCKAAVRFLRARAKDYGIDPDRIGVWGASAGGHLAALLGTSGGVKELEGDYGNVGIPSRAQAVCDYYGPTDLTVIPENLPMRPQNPVTLLLGGTVKERPDLARQASPVKHVTRDDPPTLIVHGEKDMLVRISQGQTLYDALKKAGVDTQFVSVKNAGHGFKGANIDPTLAQIDKAVLEFFDKHLKKNP